MATGVAIVKDILRVFLVVLNINLFYGQINKLVLILLARWKTDPVGI